MDLPDAGALLSPARALRSARVLVESGLLRPMRPDTLARSALGLVRGGLGPSGAFEYGAARFGPQPAVVDERGEVSFVEMAERAGAVAAALSEGGLGAEDRVGLLCRNHAGFLEAMAAVSRLGADVVLLNTAHSGPQVADVVERERVTAVIYDGDLAAAVAGLGGTVSRYVAWPDDSAPGLSLTDMARAGRSLPSPGRPGRQSRFVLLTSGTTGRPRGAERPTPRSVEPLVAMLSRIPLRHRDTTLIASPLFHAWGFAHLGLGLVLSSTFVLQRRFDAEATLAAVERHRVRVLVAVPVMLQRMVDLPTEVRDRYDTSSLEVVAASGSALPGGLAPRFMDAFGDVLYNLYGSTEAAWAAIATPADLRAAPDTAGPPPDGTEVRIVDEHGEDVTVGAPGRIVVRNSLMQEGATTTAAGGPVPDGFLATGDVGHVDAVGRLYVDGREDDMIVSGGENVYPLEVEEALASHPAVGDVVVLGVPDPEFGQRLKAYVVRRPGERATAAQLKAHVRDRLARFKVPREVVFVRELPRNAAGKVLRRQIDGGAGGP